jgi:hypothetical protein
MSVVSKNISRSIGFNNVTMTSERFNTTVHDIKQDYLASFGLSFLANPPLLNIFLLSTVTMMKTAAILASILGSVAAFTPAQTGTSGDSSPVSEL